MAGIVAQCISGVTALVFQSGDVSTIKEANMNEAAALFRDCMYLFFYSEILKLSFINAMIN